MGTKISSNPFFSLWEQHQGRDPLFDADLRAAEEIDPVLQDLQISACSAHPSPLFSINMIETLQKCAKQITKIERRRQKTISKLETKQSGQESATEVQCLIRASQALYNKEMDRFRMIGVMILGFLASQISSMENPSSCDQRQALVERGIRLSNLLKSVEDVYEETENIRNLLIQNGGSFGVKISEMSPNETWRYIRLRLPDGSHRRAFYKSVASRSNNTGTSTDLARAGKHFCVTHPKEMNDALEKFTAFD